MKLRNLITKTITQLQQQLETKELESGEMIHKTGACQILSQSGIKFDLLVDKTTSDIAEEHTLIVDNDEHIIPVYDGGHPGWDRYSYACLLEIENELGLLDIKDHKDHLIYTREGMMRRVLKERRQKAEKAEYHIQWASNIYGDHILTNERGIKYKICLRDFEGETGYSNSMDARLNKLGTTKHIMYAFKKLKENKRLFKKLDKTYPFIEIYCDPLNDGKISWYYPHTLSVSEKLLLSEYFNDDQYIENERMISFLEFIRKADDHEIILIRPEVHEAVERTFEKMMLQNLKETQKPDFSSINATLFEYQKEGVHFALFRKSTIIADEMGLGKTLQAISAAVLKKQIFDFKKTLIVCPASIKEQWKQEIERFSAEKALVIQGAPHEREMQYRDDEHFFMIANYETVLRDSVSINRAGIDFLILDEAQRVKNYETKTAASVKKLQPKHVLVITGTPIENRLIDIFSIMSVIDPYFFGPLWEFSYQHCLFDPGKPNKINGYYNLKSLNHKLEQVLIRREKRKVIDQLPNLQQINIPVNLSPLQADYHASYAKGVARIIRKKFLTPYDLQKLQILLANMRMVCDSTYLVDEETNESPKLEELKYMLLEKLDIVNTDYKIIIFSEWVKVHKLIGNVLRHHHIGFVELNGSVPVKSRGALIRKFENDPDCKIFLSTEAGGSGLNLQVADTLINFELPWNPAKKNQRIGRIDRLGQKSNKLTIYNFITRKSIEQQIAAGLIVKQNLFEGVLDASSNTDFVDFSAKGRSQFIDQLEDFIAEAEKVVQYEDEEVFEEQEEINAEAALQEVSDHSVDLSGDAAEEEDRQPAESGIGQQRSKAEELEEVMQNGMQFLAGLFKMSTGKDMGVEDQKIEVDKETGEVVMRFKLPV